MKLITVIAMALVCHGLRGNVHVVPLNLGGERISLSQILTVNVNNVGAEMVQPQFTVLLSNRKGEIFKIQTAPIKLRSGLNLVKLDEYVSSQSFSEPSYSSFIKTHGYLPYGEYDICFQIQLSSGTYEVIDGGCHQFRAGREVTLNLLYPMDESALDKVHSLTWSPVPIAALEELTYQISVVEILENQTAEEAIFNNPAHLSRRGLKLSSMLNSQANKPMKTGASYAWQVIAFLGKDVLASSEVWEFKIKEPTAESKPDVPIPVAKSGEMGNYLKVPDQFVFETSDRVSDFNLKLVDVDENKEYPVDKDLVITQKHQFQVDLPTILERRQDKKYLLVLSDPSLGRRYFVKFIF